MEHTNILDSGEEENSIQNGKRSLYCFGGNILSLSIIILLFNSVDDSNIDVGFSEFFALLLLAIMGLLTVLGCYYSIQSLRLKEGKPWSAVIGLVLHLGLVVLLCFSLTSNSTSIQVAPDSIPISE